jgi:hypothetical protein
MKKIFPKTLYITGVMLFLLLAGTSTSFASFSDFLIKDFSGVYYSYNKDAVNASYLSYQINASSTVGNMYRHFSGVINSGGAVVALNDTTKGYMDYASASEASLIAQLKGQSFDLESYLSSASAKKYSETVIGVKTVNAQGNINEGAAYIYGDWLLVSNESTAVGTTQSTGTLPVSNESIETMETADLDDEAYRINPVLPVDETAASIPVESGAMYDFSAKAVGDSRTFYTYNYRTATYSDQVTARLAYQGNNVEVWVEAGNPKVVVTDEMALAMGQEFENKIYNLIRDNYYTESDVNSDGRVAILCYDIQDNYSGSGTTYAGGYFAGNDLTGSTYSNQMELLYADTWPTMGTDPSQPDVTGVYSTLAHEFQHLVNANRNQLEEGGSTMDTWLNEALSLSAEDLYKGLLNERIQYYNKSSAIRNGRSLINWNNSNEVLANYALSYLFSQYLEAQMDETLGGDTSVKYFKEIIMDDSGGYQAVENVARKYLDAELTFGQLMTDFRAALVKKDASGIYGFGGQTDFDSISTPFYSGGTKSLEAGGAIVMSLSGPFSDTGNQGQSIAYLGLFR